MYLLICILCVFLISLCITALLIIFKKIYLKSSKINIEKPQLIHLDLVPRIGGISIFVSLISVLFFKESIFFYTISLIILSSIPVFILGFLEDLTSKIRPLWRLLASFISALLIVHLADLQIISVGISSIDQMIEIFPLFYILTILAIVSLIQSYNIIDGLNGLSSFTYLITLLSLSYIAYDQGDKMIFEINLILIFSILGFVAFNFPFGKIFLGDGGAYLIGFILSVIIILLSQRNIEISPVAFILLVLYPIHEITRSYFRRLLKKNIRSMDPDIEHFHSLVYKYILIKYGRSLIFSNSVSTMFVIVFPVFSSLFAANFYYDKYKIFIAIIIQITVFELSIYMINQGIIKLYKVKNDKLKE